MSPSPDLPFTPLRQLLGDDEYLALLAMTNGKPFHGILLEEISVEDLRVVIGYAKAHLLDPPVELPAEASLETLKRLQARKS